MQDIAVSETQEILRPRKTRISIEDKKKIVTMRKENNLSIYQIGKILKRNPSAIYKHIIAMGLETPEFSRAKDSWQDVKIAQSLKAGYIKEQVLDTIDLQSVQKLPEDVKARMAKDLSLVEGITVDQATKVVVNVQVNFGALSKEIAALEAALAAYPTQDVVKPCIQIGNDCPQSSNINEFPVLQTSDKESNVKLSDNEPIIDVHNQATIKRRPGRPRKSE